MSRRRAPSALRMPISRVRSATATSMMFMITMAPTTSPIGGQGDADHDQLPLESCSRSRAPSPRSRARSCPVSRGREMPRPRMMLRARSPCRPASHRAASAGRSWTAGRPSTDAVRFTRADRRRRRCDHDLSSENAEHAALLLHHADHAVGHAANPDHRARSDRVREEVVGDVGAHARRPPRRRRLPAR